MELIAIETPGKTIIAELIEDKETEVVVKNPAGLYTQPSQNQQLVVQLFPILFNEILQKDNVTDGTTWTFSKVGVGISKGCTFYENLVNQYKQIFNPSPIIQPQSNIAAPGGDNIIKLFDD